MYIFECNRLNVSYRKAVTAVKVGRYTALRRVSELQHAVASLTMAFFIKRADVRPALYISGSFETREPRSSSNGDPAGPDRIQIRRPRTSCIRGDPSAYRLAPSVERQSEFSAPSRAVNLNQKKLPQRVLRPRPVLHGLPSPRPRRACCTAITCA